MTVCGLAVSGSGINNVALRVDQVDQCNPKVLTLLIGANDLYVWNRTESQWLALVWAYTDKMRAKGYKVALGTVLPQCRPNTATNSNNVAFSIEHNLVLRAIVNPLIRTGVGTHIDAVIDYAADPVIGTDAAACNTSLYYDGLHPTDGCGMGCGGQGKLAVIYTAVVDRLLAQ